LRFSGSLPAPITMDVVEAATSPSGDEHDATNTTVSSAQTVRRIQFLPRVSCCRMQLTARKLQ
jgi:hypothetical protein